MMHAATQVVEILIVGRACGTGRFICILRTSQSFAPIDLMMNYRWRAFTESYFHHCACFKMQMCWLDIADANAAISSALNYTTLRRHFKLSMLNQTWLFQKSKWHDSILEQKSTAFSSLLATAHVRRNTEHCYSRELCAHDTQHIAHIQRHTPLLRRTGLKYLKTRVFTTQRKTLVTIVNMLSRSKKKKSAKLNW